MPCPHLITRSDLDHRSGNGTLQIPNPWYSKNTIPKNPHSSYRNNTPIYSSGLNLILFFQLTLGLVTSPSTKMSFSEQTSQKPWGRPAWGTCPVATARPLVLSISSISWVGAFKQTNCKWSVPNTGMRTEALLPLPQQQHGI